MLIACFHRLLDYSTSMYHVPCTIYSTGMLSRSPEKVYVSSRIVLVVSFSRSIARKVRTSRKARKIVQRTTDDLRYIFRPSKVVGRGSRNSKTRTRTDYRRTEDGQCSFVNGAKKLDAALFRGHAARQILICSDNDKK
jgi:hypothetical protein